ncbi:ABC transporter permease [Aliidiomarina shirensis]|uniref:ABC transporter permease n=1 Tax=Aliidiomarina shirensis TaxID=1048642 RepID=UPI001F53FC4B|nr:ABC transporter permease [Aliidiomarina shirensis]
MAYLKARITDAAYIVAKFFSSLVFASVIGLMLFIIAAVFADVQLYLWQWATLLVVLLLGTLPFALIGLLLGLCLSDKAAPALVNLIYLPMAFLSGLWIPIQFLPDPVGAIAYALPAYHYSQLAHAVIGTSQGESLWGHTLFLIAFCALMIAAVYWRYQRLSR